MLVRRRVIKAAISQEDLLGFGAGILPLMDHVAEPIRRDNFGNQVSRTAAVSKPQRLRNVLDRLL